MRCFFVFLCLFLTYSYTFSSDISSDVLPEERISENFDPVEEEVPFFLNDTENTSIQEDIYAKVISQASVGEEMVIDLTQLAEKLRFRFPNIDIDFIWLPENASTQYGPVFRRTFNEK